MRGATVWWVVYWLTTTYGLGSTPAVEKDIICVLDAHSPFEEEMTNHCCSLDLQIFFYMATLLLLYH